MKRSRPQRARFRAGPLAPTIHGQTSRSVNRRPLRARPTRHRAICPCAHVESLPSRWPTSPRMTSYQHQRDFALASGPDHHCAEGTGRALAGRHEATGPIAGCLRGRRCHPARPPIHPSGDGSTGTLWPAGCDQRGIVRWTHAPGPHPQIPGFWLRYAARSTQRNPAPRNCHDRGGEASNALDR